MRSAWRGTAEAAALTAAPRALAGEVFFADEAVEVRRRARAELP